MVIRTGLRITRLRLNQRDDWVLPTISRVGGLFVMTGEIFAWEYSLWAWQNVAE